MSKKDSRQEYLEKRRRQYRESKKRQRARNAGSIFEFSVRLTREDMETLNNIIEHSELNRTTAVSALIQQAQQRKQAYDISFKETDLVIGVPESLDEYYKKKFQASGESPQMALPLS